MNSSQPKSESPRNAESPAESGKDHQASLEIRLDAHSETDPKADLEITAASLAQPNAWQQLRRYTPARIALGRVGASLPTAEVLAFSMAHARARDAIHLPLDSASLKHSLEQAGFATLQAGSQAEGRAEYLRRPDLGRRLHPDCRAAILADGTFTPQRLAVVVADGLSSLAPMRHALPFLVELRQRLSQSREDKECGWSLDTIVLATEARVGLGDEVGALRNAEAVVILLGERPGLSSPDSLGIYMTYAPRPGRSDAERNCISNVRSEGLSYAEAAYKLHYLLNQARTAGASGVSVKDASEWQGPLSPALR